MSNPPKSYASAFRSPKARRAECEFPASRRSGARIPEERLARHSMRALVIGALTLAAMPASYAQTPSMTNPGGPVVGTARSAPAQQPPPPGLPGAASTNSPGAASTNSSGAPPPSFSALPPNQALFEAINHGDLAEARDAVSRGAQLDARNVLGMTPLELALDLNRNDIAFFLLSIQHESAAAASSTNSALMLNVPPVPAAMPGGGSGTAGNLGSGAGGSAGGGSVAELLLANRPPAGAGPASGPSSRPGSSRPSVAKAALVPDPPYPAGNGSPDPAVGFLGFGPRGNATP